MRLNGRLPRQSCLRQRDAGLAPECLGSPCGGTATDGAAARTSRGQTAVRVDLVNPTAAAVKGTEHPYCFVLRPNLKPLGRGRLRALSRSSATSRLDERAISKRRAPATTISMLSPACNFSASTTDLGSRTAKLFPHFETCMLTSRIYTDVQNTLSS